MSGASRVSIPNSMKKTIQNIKEIAGNHSDEEIYAMLKECSMDPNETVHKLLFQDTFHEVKRKREKRKESNREASETRWRPASQGRGGRDTRGNYAPRYTSHDLDSRRNIGLGKENGISGGGGKDSVSSLSLMPLGTENKVTTEENKSAAPISSSMSSMPNGPIKSEHLPSDKHSFNIGSSMEGLSVVIISKVGSSSTDGKVSLPSSGQSSSSTSAVPASGVYASPSDLVILSSNDGLAPSSVGVIKHKVGTDMIVSNDIGGSELPFLQKIVQSEKSHTFANGKVHENFYEIEGGKVHNTSQTASPSSSITSASGSRPSSNYSNRSQHAVALIKAGPAKEWKPKATTVNPSTVSGVLSTPVVDFHPGEDVNPIVLDNATKIQKKLENLLICDTKHVIIPDHLQVSESERSGLSFGSFDSNFTLSVGFKNEPDSEEIPTEPSESLREIEETTEELPSSTVDSAKVTEENNYLGDQQPNMPENESVALDFSSSLSPAAENDQSKSEPSLALEGLKNSVIHTAPVYSNFGLVPAMLGSHFTASESADPQAHETARFPSFIVPQPFDPSTNYYASIYRPAIDGDGRFSPLLASGAATKYSGTGAVLSSQTGQSAQESGSLLVFSSTGSNPVTQAAGVVQSSIAAAQQPVPIFRQPAGVHISHYPPNYVHYSQYFSPCFVPPPAAIHHFLGNAATFPQQPPPGGIFPLPTATVGTNPAKYPVSQYKPATNGGLTGQGSYGFNPLVYSSAVNGGNPTGNEDLASSQFKDNNVFMTGQQSEGSAVWMSPSPRDISTFQPASFYNVPPQGQPLAFAPPQAGHAASAFTGIYHPTQSIPTGSLHPLLQQSPAVAGAAEIGGPPVGIYQQTINSLSDPHLSTGSIIIEPSTGNISLK
ncbi:GBF-interacting protein 1-like [Phalaenopsis equestris]|uniref:GBF-interacting protein 1-like n=1 Tax=Phalaenopsis equestris TaxID=78828 RepID=UPI0009E44CEB|nr:GBF-interacting protein 1-like [Phalaenopsis equestris]